MKSWMTRRWCGTLLGLLAGGCGTASREAAAVSRVKASDAGVANAAAAKPGAVQDLIDPESGRHVQFVKVRGEWTRVAAAGQTAEEISAQARLDREREIEAMVAEAISAPSVGARSAAALMVADRATGRLVDTVKAIDTARDVVLNNISNAETTAFKATHVVFTDGKIASTQFDLTQGSLESTNRQLDVGIQGTGFLKIKVPDSIGDGTAYTRNGNFFINGRGEFVLGMGDGYRLEPAITFPQGVTEVNISQDGVISVFLPNATAKTVVGQLNLCEFVNAEGLNAMAGGIFIETASSGQAMIRRPGERNTGSVLQGFLEGSNVDLFRERMRLRFLQEWRTAILDAVDRTEPRVQKLDAAKAGN